MTFTELRFVPFLALVLALHWSLRGTRSRKALLLLASYAFYAAWDGRFLALIVGSTLVDHAVGRALARCDEPRRRRRWLLLSLTVNLGLLATYKYLDFFIASAVDFSAWLGVPLSLPQAELLLPVGISFYTFQTLSYSIDVYRRQLEPTRDLLDLATFVAFFPQLVAGPIVRASAFLPQLTTPRRWARVDVRGCLGLFLLGYLKKAAVSDAIAPTVDAWFADPLAWSGPSAWLGTGLYAVQIYCDFSGYSDMALACAGLLGYELCANFARPYLATDIADFWRRWHISLSTWLRDYLYIPLGGNRGGRLVTARNLMLTMLLGGLWHGAAWRFLIWGALHGLALGLQRAWRAGGRRMPAALGWALTLWWVGLAWIFFRSESLATAWDGARVYLTGSSPGHALLGDRLAWVLAGLAALHVIGRLPLWERLWRGLPRPLFTVGYGAACALATALAHPRPEAFLYFQF